jgi:DNA-binding transcriptional regulator YhcF (GntR family)
MKEMKIHTMIVQRQEHKMTTEEQQALALKTLHEAIQALKDCGLMIEEEDDE